MDKKPPFEMGSTGKKKVLISIVNISLCLKIKSEKQNKRVLDIAQPNKILKIIHTRIKLTTYLGFDCSML